MRRDAVSHVRELTIMCAVDRRSRIARFKVWERTGTSGENAPRNLLYEGERYGEAYDALTRSIDRIEEDLLPR